MGAEGRWLGPTERPLMGWLSTREGRAGGSGVLVLPAVGYAYWSSHRTLRTVAERLAGAGHTVLRVDYDATGDSAGEQSDPGRLAAWRASAAAGVAELRALGCTQITLVGLQLGGAIALLDGAGLRADAVAAWAPVLSGRRFTRQLRMIADEVPEEAGWPEGTLLQAGSTFTGQTLAELATLDTTRLDAAPAPRVLLLGTSAELKGADALRAAGSDVTAIENGDGHLALEQAAEDATVPESVVAALCDWIGPAAGDDAGAAPPTPRRRATMTWQGAEIAERVVTLGTPGLVGIVSEPVDGAPDTTLVLLNSGSEPHVGSGRAWVEYARGLAARGQRAARVDFRGWGESPDDGHAPGRPYDAHAVQDAATIAAALREQLGGRVVLAGLCAGAWVALRAAREGAIDGVVALNPQLYWEPGDPVEALMSDTRERRTPERARIERWQRRGAWTLLDVAGHRPWAGRWLDELIDSGARVSFVFSEGDDGLEYLQTRLARRFERAQRAGLRVREVAGVDHSAHRAWLRERVLDAIAEELEAT